MGALTMEIERLNKTIEQNQKEIQKNQKEVEKLTRKLEQQKEEKKTQKEYERDLKIAIENDCINCMKRDFEKEGYRNACINLQLAKTRQDILDHVPESEFERNYLDKNYERIFNKVKKIYENDMKAQEQMQQLILEKQLEEQQVQQEQMKKSPAYKILLGICITGLVLFTLMKWDLILGIGACIIIFLVILGCSKK